MPTLQGSGNQQLEIVGWATPQQAVAETIDFIGNYSHFVEIHNQAIENKWICASFT